MHMLRHALLFALCANALTGCDSTRTTTSESMAKFINQAKGPTVAGVNDTLAGQANEAAQQGDYVRAESMYRQLLDKDRKKYTLPLADAMRRNGKYDEALAGYDEALRDDPNSAEANEGKGLTLMAKGAFTEAGQAFSQALKTDGKRWRTLNGIGVLFAIKHRSDDAIAYYQEALKHQPGNPSVLNNVGLTLAMDKNYPKAIEALGLARQQLPAQSPDRKRIDLNLALVHGISGNLEEAERVAAPNLTQAGLYNNMGLYAHLAKDDRLARSYLNMALSNSPTYYDKAWENLEKLAGGLPGSGKNVPKLEKGESGGIPQ